MTLRVWLILLFLSASLLAQQSDSTNSRYVPYTSYQLHASDIKQLPLRGLTEYLKLFNGVVIQDGNVHMRGGRDDETAYFINGFSSVNPLDNTNAIYVIPEAMEKIEVLPGFFPARYGGVNSGLVFTDLKKGTKEFRFTIDYQTDKFAAAGEQFLNTYSYRDHIITATASGPAYFKDMYFFVALENTDIGDAAKRFSSGFNFKNLIDQHRRFRDDTPVDQEGRSGRTYRLGKILNTNTDDVPDTLTLTYPAGFTPYNNRNSWNINATLQYDLKPLQFDLTLLYNWEEAYANNRPMLEILNNRQDFKRYNKWLAGLKMSHHISDRLQYDVSFGYYNNSSEKYDAYFGNEWQLWDDSAAVAQATGGDVTYRQTYYDPYDYWLAGIFFDPDGHSPGDYLKSTQNYWSINSRFEWKISHSHAIEFGLNYKKYSIRQYEIDPKVIYHAETYGGIDDIPHSIMGEYAGNTYGYDYLGNETEDGFDGPRRPIFAGLYLGNSLQIKNVHLSFGLRYDYIDSDDYTLRDFVNFPIDWNTGYIADEAWKKKEPLKQISPRFTLSIQPGVGDKVYLNYGSFVQLPRLNLFYHNSYSYYRELARGGFFFYQPIGIAAEPVYTTHYEVGYIKSWNDWLFARIAAYYKKTSGLPNTERPISFGWGWHGPRYYKIGDNDISVVRGVELNVVLSRINGFQSQLFYAFSSAEGTGSTPLSYYNAVYVSGSTQPPDLHNLDFNQRHRLALVLDYRLGNDEGGIFENSGINLVSRFSSGHPYTYSAASTFG